MSVCAVCGCPDSRADFVSEVFRLGGEYALVDRIPASVCTRCGEEAFSRETTEKVQQMLHETAAAVRTVTVNVYEFV